MKPSDDYPRMMFHRTKDAVVIHSREEEQALGRDWRRTVWPPDPEPEPEPSTREDYAKRFARVAAAELAQPEPEPEPEPEPDEEEEDDLPVPPRHPAKPPTKRAAAKTTKKKR